MAYDVQIRIVDGQLLAVARGQGHAQTFLRQFFSLLDEVWKFLRANSQIKHEGLNVFLYDGAGEQDLLDSAEGMPIAAAVKVVAPFEGQGRVCCSNTPAGPVATVTHIGPYEKLSEAHAAVRGWCREHHRRLTGPYWEIYGHWNEDPAKLQTDVFYLLEPDADLESR